MKKTLACPHRPSRRRLAGLAALGLLASAALLSLSLAPRAKSSGGPIAVSVANPAPLAVSDVSSAARTPFVTQVSVSLKTTDYIGESSFTVPTGKRLVIQNVNGEADMGGSGDVPSNIRIYYIYNGGGYYIHHFRIDAHEANTNNYICNEPTLFYADGGTTVYVDLIRNTPGTTSSAYVILNGYLENP